MPSTKILLVDDLKGWRQFVCSALQRAVECQISESADGLAAVEMAKQERPDLLILDIGLPGLNGIEAGRRILEVSPHSKILYLSQESSTDVVREALQLGALGYVLKADMADELLIAVDAVLQGRQFVGRRFAALGIGETLPSWPGHSPSSSPQNHHIDYLHEVASYRESAAFIENFACFIEKALRVGNPVILIASDSHRSSLLNELEARGWDIAAAVRERRYTALDARDTLSSFMVDGWPDATRLARVIKSVADETARVTKVKHSRIAFCGECAPTLLADGNAEAAIQLEHLWDDLARKLGFQVLCGYVLGDFQIEEDRHIFERICAEHSAAYSL